MLDFEITSLKVMISCSASESDVDSEIHSDNDSSDYKQCLMNVSHTGHTELMKRS